jgi:hypothetical protein
MKELLSLKFELEFIFKIFIFPFLGMLTTNDIGKTPIIKVLVVDEKTETIIL